jgi:hypothetical protein
MRRPFMISSFALAVALAPGMLFAQAAPTQPPAGQQPTGQQPAGQPPATQTPAQPTPPAAPKVALTTPAGALLVPIKPDQTAVFEEFATKLKAGLAKTQDATLKQQAAGFKIFKSAEPIGQNSLYVVVIEPVVPNAEYDLFDMLRRTMTPEELRAPEAAEMWKRYVDAFAAGPSRLSLTPIGQ